MVQIHKHYSENCFYCILICGRTTHTVPFVFCSHLESKWANNSKSHMHPQSTMSRLCVALVEVNINRQARALAWIFQIRVAVQYDWVQACDPLALCSPLQPSPGQQYSTVLAISAVSVSSLTADFPRVILQWAELNQILKGLVSIVFCVILCVMLTSPLRSVVGRQTDAHCP